MIEGVLRKEDDIMGLALANYQKGEGASTLKVFCDKAEDETYELAYFFRSYEEMPETEKRALDLVSGKTLDVGSGTGIHAKILQEKGIAIKAIDISLYSIELAKLQGVNNAVCENFYEVRSEKYDTLLFLMNGIGLVETLDGFETFFKKCDELLSPNGQIIFDSSDLIYLLEEEDGSYQINLNDAYYGEVEYQVEYDYLKGEPFPWLFIDFENLAFYAEEFGFKAELIYEDEHYNYLGRIVRK
ncbi:MAG: methyltransferase domain-containing protein [Bacteroidales bacterium]|nr:methyltransferase domain-containing protein [Bacteroidales bacterium]